LDPNVKPNSLNFVERGRLFTDALREYLARHAPEKITEAMDHALAEIGEAKDAFVSAAA
jgi:hypothetical protein